MSTIRKRGGYYEGQALRHNERNVNGRIVDVDAGDCIAVGWEDRESVSLHTIKQLNDETTPIEE